MVELLAGLLGVAVGALLCFRGYVLMRLVLALFGALAGFALGATVLARLTGTEPLDNVWGWLGAIIGAVVLGALAYAFWAISVVLGMASIGFFVALAILAALDVHGTWWTMLGGIAGGTVFGLLAVVTDLPALILIVVTAFSGASVMMNSVLLLVDRISWEDLIGDSPAPSLSWWWLVGYLTLAVLGLLAQIRWLADQNRTVRQQWSGSAAEA